MTESDDQAVNQSRELEIPPWDSIAITRQRVAKSRAERDRDIERLRHAMLDEEIATTFGIDLGQIER